MRLLRRKLVVLGARGVGKSSLTLQYCEGRFQERYDPTIENTFTRNLELTGPTQVQGEAKQQQQQQHQRLRQTWQLDIVDTAGMDDSTSQLSRNASLGVHGYVMCYSCVDRASFELLTSINDALVNMMGGAPDIPRVVCASMMDLKERMQVGPEEGKALADSWGVPFVECSAKTGENVSDVFLELIKLIDRDNIIFRAPEPESSCLLL